MIMDSFDRIATETVRDHEAAVRRGGAGDARWGVGMTGAARGTRAGASG